MSVSKIITKNEVRSTSHLGLAITFLAHSQSIKNKTWPCETDPIKGIDMVYVLKPLIGLRCIMHRIFRNIKSGLFAAGLFKSLLENAEQDSR